MAGDAAELELSQVCLRRALQEGCVLQGGLLLALTQFPLWQRQTGVPHTAVPQQRSLIPNAGRCLTRCFSLAPGWVLVQAVLAGTQAEVMNLHISGLGQVFPKGWISSPTLEMSRVGDSHATPGARET